LNSGIKYSEQELVALLQQRSESAFSYLYDNYSGALAGVINAIIPDTETMRDVLQEVFVNIWKKIELYDASKGRLFTWMMNVARNAAIDKIRSRGYQESKKNLSVDNGGQEMAIGGVSLPQTKDIGLQRMLAGLKEEYRTLIELSYFQGYTHEEISKALGIPLGTVKTRIRSALSNLRTMIR